ncbi:MAG TPA: hypothetical protein VMT45_04265 [Thermoanaerobaculaceae bacterium]|nr:hypothetical protein [Thermoanaerobaculaceae bacterium]
MRIARCLLVALMAWAAVGVADEVAVGGVHFVFMEPEGAQAAGEAPLYRLVTDPERISRLGRWLQNDSARWAADVYRRARTVAGARGFVDTQPVQYFIALVPDGNSAAVGFRLRTGKALQEYPRAAYIQLGPEEWRFTTTLLHETGHVALAMLAGGREVPKREIAAIPHTVAAITDRGTAFDEGFAIHLETLVAHVSSAPEVRQRYRHDQFLFGPAAQMRGEYYQHSSDLLTFAQTTARYAEVRDNNFAFVSAFKGPDYLRVQMEKARDFATLRDADQLLQSEGFYGSFFFSFLMRGGGTPVADTLRQRQDKVMTALAEMFASRSVTPDTPYLPQFVESYRQIYPAEAGDVLDVFLDLTHGVFVDPDAAALWHDHYLAALRLDLQRLGREKIDAARERWRTAGAKDPAVMYSRLGPQLRCEVAGQTVKLVGLGIDAPLSMDVNTAEEGIVRLIPAITDAEVASWLGARARAPFASVEDFRARAGLSEKTLASLKL